MRNHAQLPRLYLDVPFTATDRLTLSQAHIHYLVHVLRLEIGDSIRVFNGAVGEYEAVLTDLQKKRAKIRIGTHLREPCNPPDILLAFALVRKTRTDFIVEKATELGVRSLQPLTTARTQHAKVRRDRLRSLSIEAAEQTERLDIPVIEPPVKLSDLLSDWDQSRTLVFADEAGDAKPVTDVFRDVAAPVGILTGPEGGFTPGERMEIRNHGFVRPVSLGPRILRADTAVVASLAIWQALAGDWCGH